MTKIDLSTLRAGDKVKFRCGGEADCLGSMTRSPSHDIQVDNG